MTLFDKPTHRDMAVLIELINKLDNRAERERSIDPILADEPVDQRSLGYLAAQRAMRAMGALTVPAIQARSEEFVMLASVYHEAFVMGMWWQRWEQAERTARPEGEG